MNVQVSIVIPVYNRVNLIEKAVESAINQTYKNIEIIVGDNCSNDGTWEVLNKLKEKDPRIIIFRNDENIGPVKNWVECIRRSKGEFVKVLFSDDWIDNNYIEITMSKFTDNIAFVYSPVNVVSVSEQETISKLYYFKKLNRVIKSKDFIIEALTKNNKPFSPGCALFRRKDIVNNLLVEIPNDENLEFNKYGAGNDKLIFLLTASKYKFVFYTGETCSYFLYHKNSFTVENNLAIYYKYADIFFIKKNLEYVNIYNTYCLIKKTSIEKFNFYEFSVIAFIKIIISYLRNKFL